MKVKYILLYFFNGLAIIFFSCSDKNYTTLNPILIKFTEQKVSPNKVFKVDSLMGCWKNEKINIKNGVEIYNNDTSSFLVFKNGSNFLAFYLLSQEFNLIKKDFHSNNYFKIFNNKMIEYESKSELFRIFEIRENFEPVLIDSINWLNYSNLKSATPASSVFSTNYIYVNNGLLVRFTSTRNRINYIDDNPLKFIKNNIGIQVGKYPEKYFKKNVYNVNAFFDVINDSIAAISFGMSDEVSKFNYLNNNEIKRIKISNDSGFLEFDVKKEKNLAYIDKFLATTEKNINLFHTNNRIVLFKQLGKKSKTDSTTVKCFIMDEKLDPIYSFTLPTTLNSPLIFKFNKGFIVYNRSTKSFDYYEI